MLSEDKLKDKISFGSSLRISGFGSSSELATAILQTLEDFESAIDQEPDSSSKGIIYDLNRTGFDFAYAVERQPSLVQLKLKLEIIAEHGGALETQDMSLIRDLTPEFGSLAARHPSPNENPIYGVIRSFDDLQLAMTEKGLFLGKDAHHRLDVSKAIGQENSMATAVPTLEAEVHNQSLSKGAGGRGGGAGSNS